MDRDHYPRPEDEKSTDSLSVMPVPSRDRALRDVIAAASVGTMLAISKMSADDGLTDREIHAVCRIAHSIEYLLEEL